MLDIKTLLKLPANFDTLSFDQKWKTAQNVANNNGVKLSDHSERNIIGRSNRGVTFDKVIDTYKNGQKMINTETGQVFMVKDGLALPLDVNGTGTVVTVKPNITNTELSKLKPVE